MVFICTGRLSKYAFNHIIPEIAYISFLPEMKMVSVCIVLRVFCISRILLCTALVYCGKYASIFASGPKDFETTKSHRKFSGPISSNQTKQNRGGPSFKCRRHSNCFKMGKTSLHKYIYTLSGTKCIR